LRATRSSIRMESRIGAALSVSGAVMAGLREERGS
jgi:hypothetical protein